MYKSYYRMVNIFYDEDIKGDETKAAQEIEKYIRLGYDPVCAAVKRGKVTESEHVGDGNKYCAQLCKINPPIRRGKLTTGDDQDKPGWE